MNAPDGPGICFSLAESLHCVWTGCPWIYPNHKKLFIRSSAPSANPVICRVLDLLSKKVSNSAFEGLEMLCHKRRIIFFFCLIPPHPSSFHTLLHLCNHCSSTGLLLHTLNNLCFVTFHLSQNQRSKRGEERQQLLEGGSTVAFP